MYVVCHPYSAKEEEEALLLIVSPEKQTETDQQYVHYPNPFLSQTMSPTLLKRNNSYLVENQKYWHSIREWYQLNVYTFYTPQGHKWWEVCNTPEFSGI